MQQDLAEIGFAGRIRGISGRLIVASGVVILVTAAAAGGVTAGPAAAAGRGTVAGPGAAGLRRTPGAAEPTAWIVASPGGSTSLVGIDVATDEVVDTIAIPDRIGDNVGSTAGELAISPNGKTAYLAAEWKNEIVPIDLVNGTIGAPIKVENNPVSVAITPNGSRVYVLGYVNAQRASVIAITASSGKTSKPISVGPLESAGEGGIAVTPNGRTVWVSSPENGTITAVATASGKRGKPITVAAFPVSLAVTPDGKTLWVANALDDDIVPVSLANFKTGHKVFLGTGTPPSDLAISPDGAYAFASLGSPASGAVRVTLSRSPSVEKIALVDATRTPLQVDAVAVAPAATSAFFGALAEGTVAVTTVSTAREITPISLASGVTSVTAIAITPDQAPTARFTVKVSGRTVRLNASSSSAWFGKIARYAWAFGDGKSSSAGPSVSHTYNSSGRYTITLVVTDSLGTSTSVVFTGRTVSRNGGPSAERRTTITVG